MTFKPKDDHWEVMLSFFEENKEFALGRLNGPAGRETHKKLWQKLAGQLNALGAGTKPAEKWQKTWTDFKYSLKRKAAGIKQCRLKTGGGTEDSVPLNNIESRALGILGKSFFEGVGENEVGIINENRYAEPETERLMFRIEKDKGIGSRKHSSDKEDEMPTTSKANIEHNYSFEPLAKRKKSDPLDKAYKETIEILREIKNCMDQRLGQIVDRLDLLTNKK